jgi:hypothetical protein
MAASCKPLRACAVPFVPSQREAAAMSGAASSVCIASRVGRVAAGAPRLIERSPPAQSGDDCGSTLSFASPVPRQRTSREDRTD